MKPHILDKNRVEQSFKKSIATYNKHALIQKAVCEKLINLLVQHAGNSFAQVLEIGAGTGLCTQTALAHCRIEQLYLNDLVPTMQHTLTQLCKPYQHTKLNFVMGDAETLALPPHNNLVISTSTVQWFANVQAFVASIHTTLAPGGIVAFSTFGPQNIAEITAITGKSLHYPTVADWNNMLADTFEVLCLFDETITIHFDTPRQVLSHLTNTGVNGVAVARWTKSELQQFTKAYERFFESGRGYRLTYHPLYVLCRLK